MRPSSACFSGGLPSLRQLEAPLVMSALLEVDRLVTGYDGVPVVHDVSFRVEPGSFACLLGPSGCGKTTVLRAIAGFSEPSAGQVLVGGRVVARPGEVVAPEQRRVGMVFQDNALFPHLSVDENIAFGLRGRPGAQRRRTVEGLLDVLGLKGLGGRYAHELSGGQQQRVALARALAPDPQVMLLDEPFSSLDVDLRERIGSEVRDLLSERGITTVLVTHDQAEAFALSDRIGVMKDGRILQWAAAYDLYHQPAERFVADFIGQGVFLRGRLLGPGAVETELGVIHAERRLEWPTGCEVDVLLRPDDIVFDAHSAIAATVRKRAFKGAEILYSLQLPTGSSVLSLFPSHRDFRSGEKVGIRMEADHLVAFRAR
jgi:iron(III) transport system ATP-binding protein